MANPGRRFYFNRRKRCKFCEDKIRYIDYKNVSLLQQFVMEHGKLLGRRITGTCSKHQRQLERAVKNARIIALLPFTSD